jgi:hypothetical protein
MKPEPVILRPAREYLIARSRFVIPLVMGVMVVIGLAHLVEDIKKGVPWPSALGLFAVSVVFVVGIVIVGAKLLVAKWSMILNADGSIEIQGPRARTLRVGAPDAIVCERSPDGKMWFLRSLNTGKTLERIPVEAFPGLQESWNSVQVSRSRMV